METKKLFPEAIQNGIKPSLSIWRIFDLVLPPFCCHCSKLGNEICRKCLSEIEIIDQNRVCLKCGQKTERSHICIKYELYFDKIRSWGYYTGPLRTVIQKLKYQRGIGLSEYFVPVLKNFIYRWYKEIDLVVPVPIGKKREHQRGYNQSALLAKPISKKLTIQYSTLAIERIRETASQVGLTADERKENIKGAFRARETVIKNKHVLLFDDITTTGSTLNECAKALKLAGALSVSCFTIAKAISTKILINGMEAE